MPWSFCFTGQHDAVIGAINSYNPALPDKELEQLDMAKKLAVDEINRSRDTNENGVYACASGSHDYRGSRWGLDVHTVHLEMVAPPLGHLPDPLDPPLPLQAPPAVPSSIGCMPYSRTPEP